MTTVGRVIDINADLGEGCGDDAAMLKIVSSANIACGGHAGDGDSMRRTVESAVQNGASIGAHVSYPDREHFGRRDIGMSAELLHQEVVKQILALDEIARACGTGVRYVKAHGALYNRMADDADSASAVISALQQTLPGLMLLTLPDSVAMRCAREAGVPVAGEAFADRLYTDSGRLVSRQSAGAVIVDPEEVSRRGVEMALHGRVISVNGSVIHIDARSLCVHGDTPGAVTLAQTLRSALEQAGLRIAAFA